MTASLTFHAFVAVLAIGVGISDAASPTVKCVHDGTKTVFSVIVEDPTKAIQDLTGVKFTYKASASATDDTECTSATDAFFMNAELTDATTKYTIPQATGTAANHEAVRFQIPMKTCSLMTAVGTEFVYAAQLSITTASLFIADVYDLKCKYTQSTESQDLVVESELVAELVQDSAAKITAALSITGKTPDASGITKVNLGEELTLEAAVKETELEYQTAFKYCKLCKNAACSPVDATDIELMAQYEDGITDAADKTPANEVLNCVHASIRDNARFTITLPTTSSPITTFKFPAFRFSNSADAKKLYLQCVLEICLPPSGPTVTTRCQTKCQKPTSSGRRRRSVDTKPITVTTSVALEIVVPDSCPTAKNTLGAARTSCTNGTRVGSICRRDCVSGFMADDNGAKTAMSACQEKITENIGPFYFGMKPAWMPSEPECNDVNECILNPCPSGMTCQNSIGSYTCA